MLEGYVYISLLNTLSLLWLLNKMVSLPGSSVYVSFSFFRCCESFKAFVRMPKSKFEKLKQERRQIRRSFTKIYSEASMLFSVPRLQEEEIRSLKSSSKAIIQSNCECHVIIVWLYLTGHVKSVKALSFDLRNKDEKIVN